MNTSWKFVNHQIRKPLTAQEVNYWKLSLSRILKIGIEYEFNLPEKATGTCKGKSFTCPCKHYGSEELDCWTKCINESSCSKSPAMWKCANYSAECGDPETCKTCDKFQFNCLGVTCSNRVSACVTCEDFELDCHGCSYRFDPKKNPEAIREACKNKFNPSGSYGIISNTGVHQIVTDGSLLGKKGMEVITTGRRVEYWEFFKMSKNIIDESVGRGAYTNERCSVHMHALASYYGKVPGMGGPGGGAPMGPSSNSRISELERDVPEIIVANLHQLLRKYQNAITWMTTGLDDPKKLTRWEKFRMSILDISAVHQHMKEVRDHVIHAAGGNKYGWVNYQMCSFSRSGAIKRLHAEVRVMDGILSPSACAAMACLYYALFIKAVEISRYGVLEIGDENWFSQAKKVKDALMNNPHGNSWEAGNKYGRFSDTSNLGKYTDILVAESFNLISHLKHILAPVGPAYDVLEKLAEAPCSIRRCEGKTWEEIEKDLAVELSEEGVFEYEVKYIIDTRAVVGAKDIRIWMNRVAEILKTKEEVGLENESVEEIADRVLIHFEEKQTNGEMLWADKIGSVISI